MNKHEPKPASGKPVCPNHLDRTGKTEWKRIVIELEAMGLLARADEKTIEAYCVAYAASVAAQKHLRKHGRYYKSNGLTKISPAVKDCNQALTQMRQQAVELGLTPASRSRIRAPDNASSLIAAAPAEDPMESFLRRA